MRNTLLVILGPTGVGKTAISIRLASHFNTDIISADSRQFYHEMRIGTAVPSEEQLNTVKHHFIRFISARDYYSASLFERDVMRLLPSLFGENRMAIMAGGSGMYIDAVCNGIDETPDIPMDIRIKYKEIFNLYGIETIV